MLVTGMDVMERFRAARADGDAITATRVAHSLKGVAAALGAEQLRAAAHCLETASKEGDDAGIAAALAALDAPLRRVLDGIARQFGDS